MHLWFASFVAFAWQLWLSPDSSDLLHLALALAAVACVWRLLVRAHGFWDPAPLYLALSSLYLLSPLLEVSVFGNTLGLVETRVKDAADLGVAFLLPAAIGMSLGRRPELGIVKPVHDGLSALRLHSAVISCAILVVAYVALTAGRYGLAIGTLSRGELYSSEFIGLSLLRALLVGGFAFTFALAKAGESPRGEVSAVARVLLIVALIGFVLPDLLILGDRRAVLVTLLGIATLFAPRQLSVRQVLLVVSVGTVLLLYGFVRNTPPSEWLGRLSSVDLLVQLSPAAQEFGGYAVITGTVERWSEIPAEFPGYLQALPQLLPSVVYPERPLAPSEWFVWTYFPQLAAMGASFAFNTVFEAMANAGVPAVVLVGGLFGFVIARVATWTWRGAPIGLPFAVVIFAFSMRMELASILRTAVATLVAFLVFVLLTESIARLSRRVEGPDRDGGGAR